MAKKTRNPGRAAALVARVNRLIHAPVRILPTGRAGRGGVVLRSTRPLPQRGADVCARPGSQRAGVPAGHECGFYRAAVNWQRSVDAEWRTVLDNLGTSDTSHPARAHEDVVGEQRR